MGLRVRVRAGFWLTAGALLCLDRWGVVPPLFLGAALHEAGHLAALELLEVPVRELELRASGAVIRARLRGEPREAWALGAGPAVNLLLAALCWRCWPLFALCNSALGLFNLLPLRPLDGGRLCGLLLPRRFGERGQWLCGLLHWTALLLILATLLRLALGTLFPQRYAPFP